MRRRILWANGDCFVRGFCTLLWFIFMGFALQAQHKNIVRRHFDAVGEAVLSQLQTVSIKGRYVPLTSEPVSFTAYIKFPEKMKIEWAAGSSHWTDIYEGGRAHTRQGGVTKELKGKELFDIQWMLRSISPLRGYDEGNFSVSSNRLGSKECHKVEARTPRSYVEFFLDRTSFEILLERIYNMDKPDTPPQEIKYMRYTNLGGVKVPAVFVIETNEGSADLIYDDILLGYPLPDDFLK